MSDVAPPTPGAGAPAPQRCYRHPDRIAGVGCQRCDRPICPSCMVTASVGFQCPECAKAGGGAKSLLQVHLQRTNPVVTYALISANLAIFLAGLMQGAAPIGGGGSLNDRLVLSAASVAAGGWWRPITSGFVHYGLIHIGFNMYALYLLGGALERAIGRVRFALVYGVSLIGGSLLVLAIETPGAATAGASGAVFGLFGAFAALQMSRGVNPLQTGIGTTILLNLFITFAVPGISIGGHLGGLVTGAACGAVLFGINPVQARNRRANLNVVGPALATVGAIMFAACIVVARARSGV